MRANPKPHEKTSKHLAGLFCRRKGGKVFLYSLFLVEMKGAVQVELQKGQQPLVAKENGTIGGGNRIPLLKWRKQGRRYHHETNSSDSSGL